MIILKTLTKKNITKKYLSWMNDKTTQKFTEQRYKKHKLSDLKKFIKTKKNNKLEYLFGIFIKKNNEHVGNIKLGDINFFHKTGDISYFIGNKENWKKGYASKAIELIIKIAKKKGLKKICASLYKENKGSMKVLKKNKFKLEGELHKQLIINNKRTSKLIYGLIIK